MVEDDLEVNEQRQKWLDLARTLEFDPPDTYDLEESGAWIERVLEAFCDREDMTGVLVNHLEGVPE